MAKFEYINYGGAKGGMINLSASVGTNGVNLPDDVKVVKVLLYLVSLDMDIYGFGKSVKPTEIPLPTLPTTKGLGKLIKKYQQWAEDRSMNYGVVVDGRIDPIKGSPFFGKYFKTLWTLDHFADKTCRKLFKHSHLIEIRDRFESIDMLIDR